MYVHQFLQLTNLFILTEQKKIKSYVRGRTEEVAMVVEDLVKFTTGGNLPPFLVHTLEEVHGRC